MTTSTQAGSTTGGAFTGLSSSPAILATKSSRHSQAAIQKLRVCKSRSDNSARRSQKENKSRLARPDPSRDCFFQNRGLIVIGGGAECMCVFVGTRASACVRVCCADLPRARNKGQRLFCGSGDTLAALCALLVQRRVRTKEKVVEK